MASMSYCVFENTAADMQRCVSALNDALDAGLTFEEFLEDLSSDYEREGTRRLLSLAVDLLAAADDLKTF